METIVQRPPEPEPVPPVPPETTPPPAPPSGSKNNTLAIVSLVLGILGIVSLCLALVLSFFPLISPVCACFTVLLGIGALVTGFMARNQIKISGEGGGGMATAGLVLGGVQLVLLVCGVIVILVLYVLGPQIGGVFSTINASLK